MTQEKIEKITDSLNFTIFNKDQINIVLKRLSDNKKDYLNEYSAGRIKCSGCNKIIGPKNKENLILGGVISDEKNIKFLCNQLNCYEKAIREK